MTVCKFEEAQSRVANMINDATKPDGLYSPRKTESVNIVKAQN